MDDADTFLELVRQLAAANCPDGAHIFKVQRNEPLQPECVMIGISSVHKHGTGLRRTTAVFETDPRMSECPGCVVKDAITKVWGE